MARRVFFSFSYEDVGNFKVNVIRNSWLLNHSQETFVDGSIWETAKSKGDRYLRTLIDDGLSGTSVTAVLIGEDTANRRWVNYEIVKSFDRGNGILGVHINRIRSKYGYISRRGLDPLDRLGLQISEDGRKIRFYELNSGAWLSFEDLPEINNKRSNTRYFEDSFWRRKEFGKFYRFSDLFDTFCWDFNDGRANFISWVEGAGRDAGR